MSRALAPVICIAAALFSQAAVAAGDPEQGKIKALPCMGCHGVPGYFSVYPSYRVPRLGGQHAPYIVAALKAYKSGQRDHKTMMAQAIDLSDRDMEDIAAYFSAISKE